MSLSEMFLISTAISNHRAAVELEPGVELDEEALRAHARQHLAAYKVPKRIVQIENTPRSMLGKVLRKQVREQVLPKL